MRNRAVFVFSDGRCSTFGFDARGPGMAPPAAASCPRSPPAHSPRILQTAAAARIGKRGIMQAAENGDVALVCDHIVVDSACVHLKDFDAVGYDQHVAGYDHANMKIFYSK